MTKNNDHKKRFLIVSSLSLVLSFGAFAEQKISNELNQGEDKKEAHHDEHGHHDEHSHEESTESIVVVATRLGRTANDEPVRVELIVQEEIEEKAIMRPGNISMLVAETGGVRVQTTSPALGSANIRLQGLYGRYTQLLNDGLPLYGGQASSIGLLQIPPTDLASVEIIKGSASSLYGGSAMGGVINLVSRRPSEEFEGEALINFTTEDGQDITTYLASPINEQFSASITAGIHHQADKDFDNDGWIDMAGYERTTARPRLFWTSENGASVYATAGFMNEQRQGGTRLGQVVPDGNPFAQNQDSERVDGGLVAKIPLNETLDLGIRASAMMQDHEKQFGELFENDSHESFLLESTIAGYSVNMQWVMGLAFQSERFASETFPVFDFSYDVPGVFAQIDYDVNDDLSASISARFDDHSEFGAQFSPRISLLYRPNDWTIRASYGQGYFAPTPFVEAIEAAGLSRLAPLTDIQEETAQTASVDIGYRLDNIETNFTLFGSQVQGVTELDLFRFANDLGMLDGVRLTNSRGDSDIYGSEILFRYYWQDIKLTASYLYLDATQPNSQGVGRERIELTPRHSAGFVAMWEQHGNFRIGFEAYYTGEQRLDGNPYRAVSKPYWHLGLLGEITHGRISYFVNFENLLDIRQTKEDPLVLPFRTPEGQWTTDIWSRNDGFIVNAGVRIKFGHF